VRVVAGNDERGPLVSASIVVAATALLTLTIWSPLPELDVTIVAGMIIVSAMAHRALLAWRNLLTLLIVVIMFIPVRRYTLPASLPFALEPYRVLVALVVVMWICALLIDPRVRYRKSGLGGPIGLYIAGVFASLVVNGARVSSLSTYVAKSLTFFISFLFVFGLIISVARPEMLDWLLKWLVISGAIVGAFAVQEARTGYNVFNHLSHYVPFLRMEQLPDEQGRGERLRAIASAEHAIALSALLVMLIPMAFYLCRRTGKRIWLLPAAVMAVGSFSTVSRTGFVMLVVVAVQYARMRWTDVKRYWPVIVPVLAVVHLMLPSTLGSLVTSFFPKGGLVAEQQASKGTRGSGRIADLGPSLKEWGRKPIFGEGFGTRITDWGHENAPILDDQWLGTMLETGAVGALGVLLTFLRVLKRLKIAARADDTPRGWLYVGLSASISAFAVGMITYDAFAFVQVTFLFWFLLAFAAVALRGSSAANLAQA